MKKFSSLILATVLLLTLAACGSKADTTGVGKNNGSGGKTQAVEVITGFYVNGEIDRKFDYDSNGNIILDITYKPDSVESARHTWTYDENNKLISETETYDFNDFEETRTDYSYDEKGSLCLEALSNGSRVEYINDENGNCTEQISYKADGSISGRYTYGYDAKGRRTAMTFFNADGSLNYKKSYEYDDLDRVVCEIRIDGDGEEDKNVYKYDSEGEKIATELFTDGERDREYGYELDENGVRVKYYEYEYTESTVLAEETVYTYDASGFRIRADKYEDGVLDSYTLYENDSQGRRTKITRYDDDGDFEYEETCSYTDSGLYLHRTIKYPNLTETADYEYKTIEVPAERAELIREMQMEFDP